MSKRNYNQRLSKKNWKVIIIAVVLGVLASALVFSLTDGYDNVDLKDNLTLQLNEDNYFFEKIEDGEICDTSLYDKNGKRKNIIPIEKYPDIPKESGIEKRTFRSTVSGKPIQEKYLTKTKTRLNKWDRAKMYKK